MLRVKESRMGLPVRAVYQENTACGDSSARPANLTCLPLKPDTSGMTRSNAITSARILLACVFITLFLIPAKGMAAAVLTAAMWGVAVLAEVSDSLDGWAARRYGEVSDFGKVFDPFADVFLHASAFACLAWERRLPLLFLILVLFREQAASLVRLLAAKDGTVMGARPGGKAKTVSYVVVGAAALARSSIARLGILPGLDRPLEIAVLLLCIASGALSLASLADYIRQYRGLSRRKA